MDNRLPFDRHEFRSWEAEVVYWQDLRRYRDNGYSLFGLWQSLKAQNRPAEARQAEANFQQAWALADFSLSSSRF